MNELKLMNLGETIGRALTPTLAQHNTSHLHNTRMRPKLSLRPSPVRLRSSAAFFSSVRTGTPIEEQTLPYYHKKRYYPVRIGDTLKDRYKIIAKLGYGAYSTVWLARDEMYYLQSFYLLDVELTDKPGPSSTRRSRCLSRTSTRMTSLRHRLY